MTAGIRVLNLRAPTVSALARARRRVGPKPFRALFTTVAGCVGRPSTPGVFWRGLRTVAIDATSLHVPDRLAVTLRYSKCGTDKLTFGYSLLRLSVLIECGTRAILAATFGPEADGETTHAGRLLHTMGAGMLVLADAGYDSWELLRDIAATKAQYLCRSGARRTPLILRALSDGNTSRAEAGRSAESLPAARAGGAFQNGARPLAQVFAQSMRTPAAASSPTSTPLNGSSR